MTTNLDLINIVNKLNIKNKFLGVLMKDELINLKCENDCWLICNVNNSDKNINGHWQLAWKKGNNKIYFCSFGSSICKEIKEFLGSDILTSTFRIQDWGSENCGEYAILVAYLLDRNINFEDIILEFVKIEK